MVAQHGFVIIDKPSGMTSHDVVARVRKILGTKQVGHAGTLDPMATGVLVVGVNHATKFLSFILSGRKRYKATIRLGQATTTDDKEGEIVSTSDPSHFSDEEIRTGLERFLGTIMQVPSSVSAVKIGGEPAYAKVRRGETVELAAREVTIHSLDVLDIIRNQFIDIEVEISCTAGTYIRSIARDLGQALGVGGHLIALRRTEVTPFSLKDCSAIDALTLLPLESTIASLLPIREVSQDEVRELRYGRSITTSNFSGTGVAITPEGVIAIIENREHGAQPLTVFNP